MSVQWWVDGKQVSLQEAIEMGANANTVYGFIPAKDGRPNVYATLIEEDRMRVAMPDAVTALVTMGRGYAANIALADAILHGIVWERDENTKAAKAAKKRARRKASD